MTKIQGIDKETGTNIGVNQKKQSKRTLINPKNTGIAATTAIVLASIRGFSKSKPITKTHKVIGFISVALTLLHIGCVEYLHYKYKKM